jgi:23S rRNA (adenine2030-N6)-methyltransferase
MNYRHAFHAGSFADVLKHAVLARIVVHLREKPAAFRVLDTHAGSGVYDLSGPEATRSGEWHFGIERLRQVRLQSNARDLLAPYLDAVASFNPGQRLVTYPGSPALARFWLRPQDRLTACELEPKAAAALAATLRGDRRVTTVAIDGWTALIAYLPPKERRGVVLIDPPYEADDEFGRLVKGFAAAYRKWPTGIYTLWYPIKERDVPDALARRLRSLRIAKILRAELSVAGPRDATRLTGCGLIVVNPPWRLEPELAVLLPQLADALGGEREGFRLDWLVPRFRSS